MTVNIAVVTAKGGNRSIPDKNLVDICGRPSMYWSLRAAHEARRIDHVFVTTEDERIAACARENGAAVIERPQALAQPLSNHGDVILHAAKVAQERLSMPISTVTVLLGNTVMTTGEDIDEAIDATLESEAIDSCMTVWKAQDDHPYRAMVIGEGGYLEAFLSGATPDTNRQSYPDVYFYDQGPWTVRMTSLVRSEESHEGPGPWWWMGRNCVPRERLWVTGRDTHTRFDIDIAEWWLRTYRLVGDRSSEPVKASTDE